MAPLLHRQPFKAIYIIGFLAFMVNIMLPCWLVYYSWRPNRPRKSWTLFRTVNVQMIRNFARLPFKAGVFSKRNLSLEVPQKELGPFNSRFVWIPELEKEDIVGVVDEHATRAGVKSIAIPAYWILKDGTTWSPAYDKAQKNEKVLLYLHGGAFMVGSVLFPTPSSRLLLLQMGTAHPSHPTASVAKGILKFSTSLSRLLSVDYRLSSGPPLEPENPFPAALIDAIAAYKHLVCEVGFLPQNVTVGGDSAGGNLALALIRYVVESRLPHLQPPGGFITSSPLADISFSRSDSIGSSHSLNSKSDVFSPPRSVSALIIGAYIGDIDPEETKYNRYLSPASKFVVPANAGEDAKLFSGFPRSYIMGGGAEAIFDDVVALAERMMDDGVDITTDFPPDAVHAYPMFGWHEPERTESLIKCATWFDERLVEQSNEGEGTLV